MVCRTGKRGGGTGKATYYLVDSKLVQGEQGKEYVVLLCTFFIKEWVVSL